jgi:hypothetical protein
VAGIPSAEGVQRDSQGMSRALMRIATVAGMVTLGWLLGSATALAQDSAAPPTKVPGVSAPGLSLAETAIEALPVAELPIPLTPPAQPAVLPGPAGPILEPALRAVRPQPADRNAAAVPHGAAPARTPAPAEPPRPAEPATETIPATPVSPPLPAAAPAVPGTLRTTAVDPPAERSSGWPGAEDHAALPDPAQVPQTSATTCPAGSVPANATGKSPHTVTLTEGSGRALLALVQRRQYQPADGPPGPPSQQPSTSPD